MEGLSSIAYVLPLFFLFCLICFWINTGININMHYKEDRTAAPHGAHTPFCVCVSCVYITQVL